MPVITILPFLLSLCCLAVAGVAKAYMDESSEGRFMGQRSRWNKVSSYLNKWKLDGRGNRIPQPQKLWYYCGLTPAYVERFPFSSSLFSFVTDCWHFCQFVCFNSIYLAFSITFLPQWPRVLLCFVVCKTVNVVFALSRRFILKNKT